MTNPGFRLRFDEMRENNPASSEDEMPPGESGLVHFGTPGHIRNLELVWPDGKRAFRNYSYLSGGEMSTEGDANTIALYFSSDTVIIKGYALAPLFATLLDQTARQIIITEERYRALRADEEATVVEVTFGPARQ